MLVKQLKDKAREIKDCVGSMAFEHDLDMAIDQIVELVARKVLDEIETKTNVYSHSFCREGYLEGEVLHREKIVEYKSYRENLDNILSQLKEQE